VKNTLLLEYQEYVIAHRVRTLLGGRLRPQAFLTLTRYAQKRLERQRVAREVVTVKPLTAQRLSQVDALTDELCFGQWRNPREINDFLVAVWRGGGHVIFERESEFAAQVLSATERERLPERGLEIARFINACLRLGAAAANPDEMEFAASRVETLAAGLPVFVDELSSHAEPVNLDWLDS
jgi:hypothetical protein